MSEASVALNYFKRNGSSIFATATAPGGSVAVLRISGQNLSPLKGIVGEFCEPGQFSYRLLKDPRDSLRRIDKSLVLFFKAPLSFTGEDVVEIQCHGSDGILSNLKDALKFVGVSEALPGEFSFRAVMNGKMTLDEAEKLNQLLKADSLGPLAASTLLTNTDVIHQAQNRLEEALSKIILARGRVEAAIDFPEAEEEQSAEVHGARELMFAARASLEKLRTTFENFARNSSEPTVLIMGPPNVGKSTLLNKLLGGERSLVSSVAGTTRDYVDAKLRLPSSRRIRIIDTAGLRDLSESGGHFDLEQKGMEAAQRLIRASDLIVWLINSRDLTGLSELEKFKKKYVESSNHVILMGSHADLLNNSNDEKLDFPVFNLNALNSSQSNDILERIDAQLALSSRLKTDFEEGLLSDRQFRLVTMCLSEMDKALSMLDKSFVIELVGEHLLEAERCLKTTLGRELGEDYLVAIFSQFCLGK